MQQKTDLKQIVMQIKNVYKNALNPETNINYKLIKIICNFTKYIILYFLKKEINKNDDVNYEKCLKMYKLFNYIDELDYKYSKMSYEKIKNIEVIDNFILEYKLYLKVYTISIQTDLSQSNTINNKIKEIIYDYYLKYYKDLSDKDLSDKSLSDKQTQADNKHKGFDEITKNATI